MVIFLLYAPHSVKAATPKIALDRSVFTVKKGKSIRLYANILKKKYKKKKIVWSSSKKSVASVSAKGVIRAKKKGKVTITARIKGTKFKAKCKLTVGVPVKRIEVEAPEMMLFVGEKTRIAAHAYPVNVTTDKLEFVSSNPEIVSVVGDGLVTAVAAGEAEITIKSTDGTEICSVVKITVNEVVDTGLSSVHISKNTKKMMALIEK